MIWYYSAIDGLYYAYDVYGNLLLTNSDWVIFPFKLESKYRYSGLLYDKLRGLVSYKYHNVIHKPYGHDNLSALTTRFYTKNMEFKSYNIQHYENTTNIAGSPITVVTNRTLYFIDN